jgi:hypothetical protein
MNRATFYAQIFSNLMWILLVGMATHGPSPLNIVATIFVVLAIFLTAVIVLHFQSLPDSKGTEVAQRMNLHPVTIQMGNVSAGITVLFMVVAGWWPLAIVHTLVRIILLRSFMKHGIKLYG